MTKSQSESVITTPSHTMLSPKSSLNRSTQSKSQQSLTLDPSRSPSRSQNTSNLQTPLSPSQRIRQHLLSNIESESDLHFNGRNTPKSRSHSVSITTSSSNL